MVNLPEEQIIHLLRSSRERVKKSRIAESELKVLLFRTRETILRSSELLTKEVPSLVPGVVHRVEGRWRLR